MIVIVTANEAYKSLTFYWRSRFNVISWVFLTGIAYAVLLFVAGDGQPSQALLESTLPGYLIWFYSIELISGTSTQITEEGRFGTLEQIAMSPVSMGAVLIGKCIGLIITATLQVAILGAALALLLHIPLPLRWQSLPVIGLTLIELIGLGFGLAGIALLVKEVTAFIALFQNILLFVNGAFLPLNHFPTWVAAILQWVPTAQGIRVLNHILIDGAGLRSIWRDGSLLQLILHTLLWSIVGWLLFGWCLRVAKNRGALGHY